MSSTLAKMLGELGRGSGGSGDASGQSLDNVGLFGNPTNSPESSLSSTSGQTNSRSKSGSGRDKTGDGPGAVLPDRNPDLAAPTGAADAAIPLAYRRRVAEYLRRLADDAETR